LAAIGRPFKILAVNITSPFDMLRKIFVLTLFAVFFMHAYGQTTLIGSWRRVDSKLKYHDTINKQLKWGDLDIRSDSTFHIEGDSSTQYSTISGWHVGNE
jgi:hypothetical protein